MSDFSIDYILNRAGEQYLGTNASIGLVQRIRLQGAQQQQQHNRQQQHQHHPHVQQQQRGNYVVPQQGLPPQPQLMYDWLHYTRYHPPKLPRSFRQCGPSKRTPGRLPRIPFTPGQLDALEKSYQLSNYLSASDANNLAEALDLTSTRVKIWYQNRRARERRERREKEETSYEGDDSNASSTASSPRRSPAPEVL